VIPFAAWVLLALLAASLGTAVVWLTMFAR
jgi:hypothetical protein